MSNPSFKTVALMWFAAKMRARAMNWAAIAERLVVTEEECRQWRFTHKDLWDEIFRRAQIRELIELGEEAIAVLEKHAQSADEKIARRARKALEQLRRRRARRRR